MRPNLGIRSSFVLGLFLTAAIVLPLFTVTAVLAAAQATASITVGDDHSLTLDVKAEGFELSKLTFTFNGAIVPISQPAAQAPTPAPAAPPQGGSIEPKSGIKDLGNGWLQPRTAANGTTCGWTVQYRVERLEGSAQWADCIALQATGPLAMVIDLRPDPIYGQDGMAWWPKGRGSYRVHRNGTWGDWVNLKKEDGGIRFTPGEEIALEVSLEPNGSFVMALGDDPKGVANN